MNVIQLRRDRDSPPPDLARALAAELRGEVRFDTTSRALYATDASNYRHVPIGVVIPRDAEDVSTALRLCREHDAPVLARGGGTSLAGQGCNVAVVLDFGKYMTGVVGVDVERRLARVQPGCVLDELRARTEPHGLTYGPDPATHDRCTLGGMIGNNSCGVHGVLAEFYGPGPRTEDNVESLEVLTYDGLRLTLGPISEPELLAMIAAGGRRGALYARLRDLRERYAGAIRGGFPQIPRRVSGYNLEALLPENGFNLARALTGSEGTCVTLLEATVKLSPLLPERVLLVLGYPSVFEAADHVPELRRFKPVGLEGMDDELVGFMRRKQLGADDIELLPEAGGWLLVEFGADTREAALASAEQAMAALRGRHAPSMRLVTDRHEQERIWEVRESGLGATAFVPGMPDTWEGWEDSAVPIDRVGAYLRDLKQLFERYGYRVSVYGHFGQGCIHCRVPFELTSAAGIAKFRAFTSDAADLVVSHGGSLSGEHGDGQARGDLLDRMFGPELLSAMREFKAIWDPAGRMNPGRIVDTPPRDANLRLGADYRPWRPETKLAFRDDAGDLSHAALRCVGVGKCRRLEGGTMCPSYMVTREEKHTTRGRAHLLFEMAKGELITDGWKSEEVKESLELCLSCKGCKSDCPVNVDLALYKSEFLSHYYEGKLRPRHAYAFGLIRWWARLGSLAPGLVNAVGRTPGLSALVKWLGGVADQRDLPHFAARTFRSWFDRRPPGKGGKHVMLWPDTFNNHFSPETLVAAVEVLEEAGCQVTIPRQKLCCGRPLYDFGMLDVARKWWLEVLDALEPEIAAGIPLVGVEPSCVAAFRDELLEMLPDDERAKRLSGQTFTLAELLVNELDGYTPPRLDRKAILQGHCQHKAVMKLDSERKLLEQMGVRLEIPEPGCCGMAGAFGFERDKYEVSKAIGERALLPAVRKADPELVIVADGFSCREQVHQGTGRRPLHLAELLQLGLHREQLERAKGRPEQARQRLMPRELLPRPSTLMIVMVALVALLFWLGFALL
jgi:FAD/FMN-containing dehydrogenase/Fe-S oxidoreductase